MSGEKCFNTGFKLQYKNFKIKVVLGIGDILPMHWYPLFWKYWYQWQIGQEHQNFRTVSIFSDIIQCTTY